MSKSKPSNKPKCNRCGKCCVVWDLDFKDWIDCKWLIRYNDHTTGCAIYRHRLGAIVGDPIGIVGEGAYIQDCGRRADRHYNIPGCPFNKKGQILHDHYKR